MIDILDTVINATQKNGIRYTLSEIKYHMSNNLAQSFLPIYNHMYDNEGCNISIKIGDRNPGADVIALLDELESSNRSCTLYILHRGGIAENQISHWDDYYTIVTTPIGYLKAISDSKLVLYKSASILKWARKLDNNNNRLYVRLYHGPITKAYEKTKSTAYSDESLINVSISGMDSSIKSVGSDVERYYRASAQGVHPNRFRAWGYPRFDRINRLLSGDTDTHLPNDVQKILKSSNKYTDILYAPTHKDGAYTTTFFPFSDFDSNRLHDWCQNHDVRVFLRPHPSEEPKHTHITDNETVYYVGSEVVNSTTEMMPHIDALITDYSSIYIPYLLFDRPVIFVKDNHKRFKNIRGFGFNYDRYFPGPKPDTFEHFLSECKNIVNNVDKYSDNRSFVRDTLVSPHSRTFLDECFDSIDVDS
jgi:CDP-glycerol glycerophosphotransferase (TagB/SpsB family)